MSQYYELLHNFYNINKLKINPDKSKFLVSSKPRFQHLTKNLSITAKQYTIKQSNIIKILGTYIRKDLKLDSEIGKLCSQLHNRIHNVRKLTKYTDFTARLSFMNGYVIGKLHYMLPLYTRLNTELTSKIHKVMMTAARVTIGNYCCRKTITQILSKCKWLEIKQLIKHSSTCLLHKIIINQTPKSITNKFQHLETKRKVVKPNTKYNPKTETFKNFYLYKTLKFYNTLPMEILNEGNKQFKISLKNLITTSDTMD